MSGHGLKGSFTSIISKAPNRRSLLKSRLPPKLAAPQAKSILRNPDGDGGGLLKAR